LSIYIVRHGVTDWNLNSRAQGHTDISLNAQGVSQVSTLCEAFQGIALARILCSDLTRCRETAAPIHSATGAPVQYLKQLRERSFGEWEGDLYGAIHKKLKSAAERIGQDEFFARPDGGESMKDVWDRIDPIFEMLASSPDDTCVVTHGGVCAILLTRFLQGTYSTPKSFRFENASITQLEARPDGAWRLVRFCDVSHLKDSYGEGG